MKFEFDSLADLKAFLEFMQVEVPPMPADAKERVKAKIEKAVEPVVEVVAEEPEAEEEPKGVKKKADPKPKKADLAESAMKAVREKVATHSAEITEALAKYDAKRISQLSAADLPKFIEEIEAL